MDRALQSKSKLSSCLITVITLDAYGEMSFRSLDTIEANERMNEWGFSSWERCNLEDGYILKFFVL